MVSLLKKVWPIGVVLLASIFAILPLFHIGFFPMHDDTQVQRVYEMGQALKDGQFPVRWVQDLGYGYGYPIFNFYAPLAYYVGGLCVLLGLNALAATKLMIGIGIVLSGGAMYFLGSTVWGKKGGMLSSIVYVYATYHAVDIYVRGDVAEFWAYAFIPVTFLGIYKVYSELRSRNDISRKNFNFRFSIFKKIWKWVVVGSIGYTGVILSHNLTALMVTPFVLLFVLILTLRSYHKLCAICYMLLPVFLGLLLSAFYFIPVMAEMGYTNILSQVGGSADFHNHFVCLGELWYSPWGYGGSAPGCVDGLSFMLGKITIILGVVGLSGLLTIKKTRFIGMLLGGGLLFTVFLTTNYSQFIWDLIKIMAFFQYPWRFLLLIWFFLSLIIGSLPYTLEQIKMKYILLITVAIIGIFIFFQQKFFTPKQYSYVSSNGYVSASQLTWTTSKISDEYMPKNFIKPQSISEVPQRLVTTRTVGIVMLHNKTQEKKLIITSNKAQEVQIALAYFPFWHAFINGKEVTLVQKEKGMQIYIPQGVYTLDIRLIQTSIEQIGNILSLCGLFFLILGIIIVRQKNL